MCGDVYSFFFNVTSTLIVKVTTTGLFIIATGTQISVRLCDKVILTRIVNSHGNMINRGYVKNF
jgi:hypothetical protein